MKPCEQLVLRQSLKGRLGKERLGQRRPHSGLLLDQAGQHSRGIVEFAQPCSGAFLKWGGGFCKAPAGMGLPVGRQAAGPRAMARREGLDLSPEEA